MTGHVSDLLALVHETWRVLRKGSVAALVAMLFMLFAAIALTVLVSMIGALIGSIFHYPMGTGPGLVVLIVGVCAFYALVPAMLQAGPLAAYGLVALGDEPGLSKTIGVALFSVPRLALLYLVFVVVPLFGAALLPIRYLENGLVGHPVVEAFAISVFAALVVWSHARLLLFLQLSFALKSAAPWRERPPSWRLGQGRFPLQLAATLAPYALIVAARPSASASELLDHGVASALAITVAIAGGVLFAFLRPALAAASYAVALGPPPEKPTA